MPTRLIVIGILFVGVIYYLAVHQPSDQLAVSKPVPTFNLADSEGKRVQLESLRGEVVLVNFWATTCYPCTEEMPSLNRLAMHFAGRPFRILGISEDGPPEIAWGRIQAYRKEVPVNFSILLDSDGQVADQFGTYALPESYLIDSEGKLVRKVIGAIEWDHQQVKQEIESLLPPS